MGILTKEILISKGWIETGDSYHILEKEIENRNPINNTPEDTGLRLTLHRMYNVWTIAIVFPDGGLLNLNIDKIEDLDTIEKLINFYDCPY